MPTRSNEIHNTMTIDIPLQGENAKTQLSWIIRNFFCSICEAYLKGAPRREQAFEVVIAMCASAHQNDHITSEESAELLAEIDKIEEQVYPGCSLL